MGLENIDILYYLFNYYEIYGNIQNGKIFLNVIDAINSRLGVSFRHSLNIPKIAEYEQNTAAGIYAIDSLVFDKCYQEYVLALLGNNHYYMKTFIKDLIKALGNAKSEDQREQIISQYLELMLIIDIKYNGVDEYTIDTAYGRYSFKLADKVLKDDYIVSYIREKDCRKICHGNATTILNDYPELYTICSQVRNYFVGSYYHSYSYIAEEDLVLDMCSNMLMKKSDFDDLFCTREILFMRNDELKSEYFKKIRVIKSKLGDESVLKCALYYQAKELESNPNEKKIVLDYNRLVLQDFK